MYNIYIDFYNSKTYKNKNWVTQVRTILETHGFANIWANQSLDKYTLEIIKTRIQDIYYQNWYSEINNFAKTTNIRLI